MKPTQPKTRLSGWLVAVVFVIGIAGGVLRLTIASGEQFWLDELHTAWVVDSSIDQVAPRAAIGNQNPLYFWICWTLKSIFDSPELSIRLLSIAASLLAVFTSACFVWRQTSSSIATIVVAVVASSGLMFIQYGTEARPYALLHLLGAIHFFLLYEWLVKSRPGPNEVDRPLAGSGIFLFLLFTTISVALVYTHVTSISIFAAEFAWLVIWLLCSRSNPTQVITSFLGVMVVTFLICIPLVASNLEVLDRRENWANVSDLNRVWIGFRGNLIACLIVPLVALFIDRFSIRTATKPDHAMLVEPPNGNTTWIAIGVALWAIVPVLALIIAEWLGLPMALPRYAQVGAMGFPVFAAIAIALISSNHVRLLVSAIVVACVLLGNPIISIGLQNGELPLTRHEDWKTLTTEINSNLPKSKHPVFLMSNLIEDVDAIENQESEFQEYLKFPVAGVNPITDLNRVVPRPTMPMESPFTTSDRNEMVAAGGAYILVRAQQGLVEAVVSHVANIVHPRVNEQVKIGVLNSPDSDVYLISVDW